MAKASKGRGDGRSGSRSRARSGQSRASRPQTKRHYPRTARLNTLLQEIVAGFMERIDDDRISFVTVTGVEVDNDLNRAEVFISTFEPPETAEAEAEFLDALGEYRKPIQAEIAREARLRKTPEVVFLFDPAVRAGARIEEILSSLGHRSTAEIEADPDPVTGTDAETGTGAETGQDAETGTEAETGQDSETGTEADPDPATGTDAETGQDSAPDQDTEPVGRPTRLED